MKLQALTALKAALPPAEGYASPALTCAATQAAAVIQDEISAIAEAEVAATETNSNPWAVAEDEERHHEADDLVAELKVQLKSELEQPDPAAACHPELTRLGPLTNFTEIAMPTIRATPQPPPIHVFNSRPEAMAAIQKLEKTGFDTKKLSLVGTGLDGEQHPVGFYAETDAIKTFGTSDAFWTGVWALLLAPAMLFIPGLGLMGMAGPVVSVLVGGVEGAVMIGGMSALGLALTKIGVPEAHAAEYEAALKKDKYVLITHGTADDAAQVDAVLEHHAEALSGDAK